MFVKSNDKRMRSSEVGERILTLLFINNNKNEKVLKINYF